MLAFFLPIHYFAYFAYIAYIVKSPCVLQSLLANQCQDYTNNHDGIHIRKVSNLCCKLLSRLSVLCRVP